MTERDPVASPASAVSAPAAGGTWPAGRLTPAFVVPSIDGTPIAVFRDGGDDRAGRPARPVVLVHGTTADHTTWRVVGPMLARSRRVLALDRRGRGASGDASAYDIEREFDDLAAVADRVAVDHGGPVDVVGHSFGGRIGLGAALRTTAIRRLVVYEGAPAPPGAGYQAPDLVPRLQALLDRGDRAETLRTFMREVVGMTAADLRAFEEAPVWPLRVAAAPTILRELRAEASTSAGLDVLGAARLPVLQLVGGASLPVFLSAARALDERLPDGRLVVLPGQKHAAHHSAPEAFVAEVRRFLDV